MEGVKEAAEEEEEEEELHHHHVPAASSVDQQDLPIMHWEDLSRRIAELEQQEQERRERSKRAPGVRGGGLWRDVWEEEEDEEDFRRCRVSVIASRQTKLQLCFVNDSGSEEEEEAAANQTVTMGNRGRHGAGLKQEVVVTLRTLRDQLLAEQKERAACSTRPVQRKHLDLWQLQELSVLQISSLKAKLQQEVHALSSDLVTHLLVRDQLRTKQDAMLLDVQDLT